MVQISNNPAYSVLRVKFKKLGDLQYISHLDLVRTMHKIIVRADLPLWYTEGFNPKPKMVFAAPLSIGTESLCEFMDVRVTERIDPDEAMQRLNDNMAPEMQVVEAYYPEVKITELAYLAYEISIKTNGFDASLLQMCKDALSAAEIKVLKKTKSGEADVDIKPLILSAEVEAVNGEMLIKCVLSADPSSFLNPEYVVKYLKDAVGILADPKITNEWYSILRTAAYKKDMTEFK